VTLEQGRPTALVLSRQDLPVLDPAAVDVRGAVLAEGDDGAIVATGSEVAIALAARQLLLEEGVRARVVSLPSFELFRQQPEHERRSILPPELPAVAVEAASPFGWSEFAGRVIGMTTFGASAKAADLFPTLGSPRTRSRTPCGPCAPSGARPLSDHNDRLRAKAAHWTPMADRRRSTRRRRCSWG
jgi:transketolase